MKTNTYYQLEKLKARNNRLLGFAVGVITTLILIYFIGGQI
tara:strand:+ start:450 stop:572 length:123 start_codon:yes stop_codon:yes gene_type:complete